MYQRFFVFCAEGREVSILFFSHAKRMKKKRFQKTKIITKPQSK
ncbi:hypothetical protein SSUST1_0122 [Streptococcus suis ST1]|nr:hypothetical protein SSUST1_0122 [Streptococcus suis ST1]